MKILIITNDFLGDYIVNSTLEVFKCSENKVKVVKNKVELKKIKEFKFDFIIITVELFWEDRSIFQGYQVAMYIIDRMKIEYNPTQLLFVSAFSRGFLFNQTLGMEKSMSKSFFHFRIHQFTEEAFKNFFPFSVNRWNYIKTYNFKNSGIISRLLHDYFREENSWEEIQQFKRTIEHYLPILDSNFIKLLKAIQNTNDFIQYKSRLYGYLVGLIESTDSENGKKKLLLKRKYKLVVIEDKEEFTLDIKNKLSNEFIIESFVNGKKAIQRIVDTQHPIDLVICDLELIETDGCEQAVQGIDIVQLLLSYPEIPFLILTNMPKHHLRKLIPEISVGSIWYKSALFGSLSQLEFSDFKTEIYSSIKNNFQYKYLVGPDSAIWSDFSIQKKKGGGLKRFYYNLKKWDESEFNLIWQKIEEDFQEVLKKELQMPTEFPKPETRQGLSQNKNQQKVKTYLSQFLLHRRFWLHQYYTDVGLENLDGYYGFFQEFAPTYNIFSNHPKSISNYFQLIGFSVKNNNLSFKKLFPEEVTYLSTISAIKDDDNFPFLIEISKRILNYIKESSNSFDYAKYKMIKEINDFNEALALLRILSTDCMNSFKYARIEVLTTVEDYIDHYQDEYKKLKSENRQLLENVIKTMDVISTED